MSVGPLGTPPAPLEPCPRCGLPLEDDHECSLAAIDQHVAAQRQKLREELDALDVVERYLRAWENDPHAGAPDADQPAEHEASWERRRAFADWQRERETPR